VTVSGPFQITLKVSIVGKHASIKKINILTKIVSLELEWLAAL